MLEANALLAMFIVQIVLMTVAYPASLIRRFRESITQYPPEQFPQLYPPGSAASGQRTVSLYRRLNTVVALGGLALLAWFFMYTRQPDWDDDTVNTLVVAYFLLQMTPLGYWCVTGAKQLNKLRNLFQAERRTATLERRGLFDFVSPFVVFLTLLCYPLAVGLVIYVERDSSDAFLFIGGITLAYAVVGLGVYASLYGKRTPFQTHEDRMRAMATSVRASVYTCLVVVAYLALSLMLEMLDLQPWAPFAMSVYLVICGALAWRSILNAIPRQLKLDGLRPTLRGASSAG
jgi:hypothetical protein